MAQAAFILILTGDEGRGQWLRELLRERYGHSCNVVTTLEAALESIRQKTPDVVVTDARVDGSAVSRPLAKLLDSLARDAALIAVGDREPPPPSQHIRFLALAEPAEPGELVDPIARAAAQAVSRRADRQLRQSIAEYRYEVFEGLVGISPQIHRIIERIKKAARTNLTVLILGETGVGKELIAEAIHKQSPRARRALKALNCAGVNENLLESELFGHVRGAFTGAVGDRKGYFEAAHGGTLFLDEIGDMPISMQAKLLRALERREVTPVGSTDVRKVDVRLIAATHADLRQCVEEKRFREDLYYRLNQWVIEVPPLRERRQDIPLLAHYLLERANRKHGTNVPGISSEALGHLAKHYWPGNVRELSNLMEVLAVEVADRRIEADDLPEHIRGPRDIVPASAASMVGLTMAEVERLMIERTLAATGGNREQAAKMLDIGTRTLYRKIKEYGIQ